MFGIDTGDVSGHLNDLYVGMDYGFGDRFAVGLAYNDVSMDIGVDKGEGGFTRRARLGLRRLAALLQRGLRQEELAAGPASPAV